MTDMQKPWFGNVDEWLNQWLRQVWKPRIDGRQRVWRADWWAVPEAVCRLDALWRAWEACRLDGLTGMSIWWAQHFDHHITVLTDPQGPFAGGFEGEQNQTRSGTPLPYLPPPHPEAFPLEEHRAPCHAAQYHLTPLPPAERARSAPLPRLSDLQEGRDHD